LSTASEPLLASDIRSESTCIDSWLFTVTDVSDAISKSLQKGKAPGLDGLVLEHFLYSHPSIYMHLTRLFNLMIKHGVVPNGFGEGLIVPLIKEKFGDVCSSENYRGITLCHIISKIFEICLLRKIEPFLNTHDLQMGFKKGVGCGPPTFLLQQVVKYFTSRGSRVYLCAIDASKAFDRINHSSLFTKLLEKNVPLCFVQIIINWYSKLLSCVRWNDAVSTSFRVHCGVRQGGILSPILFNLYVDNLIESLQNSGLGCYICTSFLGCIMYADDLILLSPSIDGLQGMLNLCTVYGANFDIMFNVKKTVCIVVGKHCCVNLPDMFLSNLVIPWSEQFKYLGIVFNAKCELEVDCSVIKRKFYASFNSIIYKCSAAAEPVKLHLIKSYCLPLLTYNIGALELSKNVLSQLGICWNDAFRKIFGFHRWESVKLVQYFCQELSFDYIYDLARWQFLESFHRKISYLNHFYKIFESQYNLCTKFRQRYSPMFDSHRGRIVAVWSHFEKTVQL